MISQWVNNDQLCHDKWSPLAKTFNIHFTSICHSTVARFLMCSCWPSIICCQLLAEKIRLQEILLQWHLDINKNPRVKQIEHFQNREENNPKVLSSSNTLNFLSSLHHQLTCIRMCLDRRDAHEVAGHPIADRGCLMLSRWLCRGNPPHGCESSWWWSWNAGVSQPWPQLEGRRKVRRK